MAILRMFCVHDVKAEAFAKPFAVPTRGIAIRAFADQVNNPDSDLHKHPEDYTLFQIGEFDESTGMIQPQAPESLGSAVQYLEVVVPSSPALAEVH